MIINLNNQHSPAHAATGFGRRDFLKSVLSASTMGLFVGGCGYSKAKRSGDDLPYYENASSGLGTFRVDEAGLVLVSAFYEVLFSRMGLIENQQFVSESARYKAIMALHFLATGQIEVPENQLILNKVLCGYPIALALEESVYPYELDHEDRETVESLIQTVISYWPAINGSSIDGFRENWMNRSGQLLDAGDHWALTVERHAYDLLLSQSPFAYSTVSFKWMSKPLYVTWPIATIHEASAVAALG